MKTRDPEGPEESNGYRSREEGKLQIDGDLRNTSHTERKPTSCKLYRPDNQLPPPGKCKSGGGALDQAFYRLLGYSRIGSFLLTAFFVTITSPQVGEGALHNTRSREQPFLKGHSFNYGGPGRCRALPPRSTSAHFVFPTAKDPNHIQVSLPSYAHRFVSLCSAVSLKSVISANLVSMPRALNPDVCFNPICLPYPPTGEPNGSGRVFRETGHFMAAFLL